MAPGFVQTELTADLPEELLAEANAYRADIDAAWRHTGPKHFPPSWEKSGTHWGNTETLWPTELFYRDDPRVAALSRHVRTEFAGGFIEVFVSKDRLSGLLPENRGITVLIAAGLGILFPVCECAIVPVVRRLLRKGVPLGGAIAFLLGGPIVNPVVAAATAVAYSFKWSVVIDRMLIRYFVAVTVGTMMNMIFLGKATHIS